MPLCILLKQPAAVLLQNRYITPTISCRICVQNLKITYSVSTALIDKNDQFAGTLTKTTWQVILPPGRKIFINTRNKITLM